MTAKTSILTDSEKAVVQTITMKLQPAEALKYLHDCGIKMAERSYYRYKKRVESLKWERLIHAANRFTEQHLQRLDKLELIERLMWRHYDEEPSPSKKVKILESIVSMQPYLSNYYDATRFVLKSRLKTDIITAPTPKPQLENKFSDEEKKTIKRLTPFSGHQDYDVC